MIKVSIPAVVTRNMTGIGKTSQKPYNLEFQTVYVHTIGKDGKPAPFPEKLEIILDRNEQGQPLVYAVGEYLLHPSSLYVDRTGSLAVAPRLAPLTKS
ncbi:single-stranded DNA-binding protein [Variovorax sp. Varisp85]|uniref:single-stranded DNA-binding protein n=1 Tax=Variovorax sp. Varisp85 TaxID=3243059 RepID=UPI0039A70486